MGQGGAESLGPQPPAPELASSPARRLPRQARRSRARIVARSRVTVNGTPPRASRRPSAASFASTASTQPGPAAQRSERTGTARCKDGPHSRPGRAGRRCRGTGAASASAGASTRQAGRGAQGLAPFRQAAFPSLNFLPAADQADDRRAIRPPLHDVEQMRRLGLVMSGVGRAAVLAMACRAHQQRCASSMTITRSGGTPLAA